MNRHAFRISIYNKVFKFRKWFKYGLMAQKFQKQHALKGQKLLAQGSALGILAISNAPCKVGCANHTGQKCFEILY